ncbi:MAG: hypothetical protein ACXITR_04430 [Cyanobacterium sp.]
MSLKLSVIIINSLIITSSISFKAIASESNFQNKLSSTNSQDLNSETTIKKDEFLSIIKPEILLADNQSPSGEVFTEFQQKNSQELLKKNSFHRQQLKIQPLEEDNITTLLADQNKATWEIFAQEGNGDQNLRYTLSPLEIFLPKPINIPTAETMPKGTMTFTYGLHNFSTGSVGLGSGLQVYGASLEYSISDRLQIGIAYSDFDDILGERINNELTFLDFKSFAPSFKYQLINKPSYTLAVAGSAELLRVAGENRLFTPDQELQSTRTFGGTLQVPVTFNYNENVKFHLLGGLAIFADTINDGGDFYGTFFHGGAGVSAKLGERFGVSADFNYPLIGKGNSVDNQGNINKSLVWSASVNYLYSPAVALDLYLTNALGVTPATKLLTFIPDPNQVAVGLNVRWTPDFFVQNSYRSSFANEPLPALTPRDKQLLFDGFTLNSAETLRKGNFLAKGVVGGDFAFQLGYGLSDDVQLEILGFDIGRNDENLAVTRGSSTIKFGVATKIRILNQAQGAPFSLSLRGELEGTDLTNSGAGVGTSNIQALLNYQTNEELAFIFSPKAGFFAGNDVVGVGLGVNYQPISGLQFIGEITPMITSNPLVWAVGARYMAPQNNWGLGVYGTNAIGSHGITTLLTQSDSGVSVGVNLLFFGGR